jgi:hypothetical protein
MTNLEHRLEIMMANLLLSEHYVGINTLTWESQYRYTCANDGTEFVYEGKNPDNNPIKKEAIQYIIDWLRIEWEGEK